MEYDKCECKSKKGITAFGYYKQDGKFVVLKGSFAVGDSELTDSFFSRGYPKERQRLIATKKLEKNTRGYQFTEDVEFDFPSPAASIILGNNENGRLKFQKNGQTVRIEENIVFVNKTLTFTPDSVKTVESHVLYKQSSFKEEDDEVVFPEGKEVYRLHRSKERNKAVINLAKKKGKGRDPLLCCSVCGFSFSEVYGAIGEDFIEAHHTKPL